MATSSDDTREYEAHEISAVQEETRDIVRMLTHTGYIDDVEDVLDFLDKPWKWGRELALWQSAGRPFPDSAGWSLFEARLSRREQEESQW